MTLTLLMTTMYYNNLIAKLEFSLEPVRTQVSSFNTNYCSLVERYFESSVGSGRELEYQPCTIVTLLLKVSLKPVWVQAGSWNTNQPCC